jgi:hypothetical protein
MLVMVLAILQARVNLKVQANSSGVISRMVPEFEVDVGDSDPDCERGSDRRAKQRQTEADYTEVSTPRPPPPPVLPPPTAATSANTSADTITR